MVYNVTCDTRTTPIKGLGSTGVNVTLFEKKAAFSSGFTIQDSGFTTKTLCGKPKIATIFLVEVKCCYFCGNYFTLDMDANSSVWAISD